MIEPKNVHIIGTYESTDNKAFQRNKKAIFCMICEWWHSWSMKLREKEDRYGQVLELCWGIWPLLGRKEFLCVCRVNHSENRLFLDCGMGATLYTCRNSKDHISERGIYFYCAQILPQQIWKYFFLKSNAKYTEESELTTFLNVDIRNGVA